LAAPSPAAEMIPDVALPVQTSGFTVIREKVGR